MAQHHSLAVTTHGHYWSEPAEGPEKAGLLVGFHGYGETAASSLAALQRIPGASAWARYAIQGLHVFYRQSTGEVVGSWMTSFQRDQAIRDNTAFTGAVLAAIEDVEGSSVPRVLAGFSQGVAMAYRTAAFSGRCADGLIALAGDVPPDLGREDLERLPPILIGQGKADKWYNQAKLDADLGRLRSAGAQVEVCRFEGGHEWAEPFLEAAGRFLASLSP